MNLQQLQFQFVVDGVPTNAAQVLLASPDPVPPAPPDPNRYGVKRTDTGQIIVPYGTAMNLAAMGVYRYPLLSIEAGVPLSWFARATYNGVQYSFERQTVTKAFQPAGLFCVLQDIYNVGGVVNVNRFSNLDRTAKGPDLDRIQSIIDQGDAQIIAYLSGNGLETPAAGSANFSLLTQAAAWLDYALLYWARGDTQSDSEEFGRFNSKTWIATCNRLLEQYGTLARQDISTQVRIDDGGGPGWSGPVVIIP